MLGLIFLFCLSIGLWLWIYLTKVAMRLGGKLAVQWKPHHPKARQYGRRAGFMLLMGGWWIWWGIEHLINYYSFNDMCKKVGFEMYITPNQWKSIVGGEETWKSLTYKHEFLSNNENLEFPRILYFQNKKYRVKEKLNDRIIVYLDHQKILDFKLLEFLYYDHQNGIILAKDSFVNISANAGGFSLKIWKNLLGAKFLRCNDNNDIVFSELYIWKNEK